MAMIPASIMRDIPNRKTRHNESSPLDGLQGKLWEILSRIVLTREVDEEELMERIGSGKPED